MWGGPRFPHGDENHASVTNPLRRILHTVRDKLKDTLIKMVEDGIIFKVYLT